MPNIAISSSPILQWIGLATLLVASVTLRAEQFGLFTYVEYNDTTAITG